jgi:hypothetical protein
MQVWTKNNTFVKKRCRLSTDSRLFFFKIRTIIANWVVKLPTFVKKQTAVFYLPVRNLKNENERN